MTATATAESAVADSEVEARQSAKLSAMVRCVPKEQPQQQAIGNWQLALATGTGKQQTLDMTSRQAAGGRRQAAGNSRKSSEWPMTTKLAVKHTKITSNGQKVNKIKQCARKEHDLYSEYKQGWVQAELVPGCTAAVSVAVAAAVAASQPAACATCCQHSVSGVDGCRCLDAGQHNPPADAQLKK